MQPRQDRRSGNVSVSLDLVLPTSSGVSLCSDKCVRDSL